MPTLRPIKPRAMVSPFVQGPSPPQGRGSCPARTEEPKIGRSYYAASARCVQRQLLTELASSSWNQASRERDERPDEPSVDLALDRCRRRRNLRRCPPVANAPGSPGFHVNATQLGATVGGRST